MQKGDQDRIAPHGLHPLELLGGRFPAQLREPFHTIRVEPAELPGVDPGLQEKRDLLECLDNLRGGVGGCVPAEPLEHGAARLGIWPEEAVEPGVQLPRQQGTQAAKGLLVGLLPRRGHQPLQPGEARADDTLAAELVTSQLEQQRGFVVLERALHQPHGQGIQIEGQGLAKPQMSLDLLEVHGPRGNPTAVGGKGCRRDTQLVCDIIDGLPRGGPEVIGGEPQIAEGTELHGKAQASMVLTLLVDRRIIGLG
jgi:hypothetical protein